jgi:hypothetical protein
MDATTRALIKAALHWDRPGAHGSDESSVDVSLALEVACGAYLAAHPHGIEEATPTTAFTREQIEEIARTTNKSSMEWFCKNVLHPQYADAVETLGQRVKGLEKAQPTQRDRDRLALALNFSDNASEHYRYEPKRLAENAVEYADAVLAALDRKDGSR